MKKREISCISPKDHYLADACIVWCFDDRFSNALQVLIQHRGLARCDVIRVAGGAKSLASSVHQYEWLALLQQIRTSLQLHKAGRIVLMTHSDCGAYGGLSAFKNDSKRELAHHIEELGKAKKFLLGHCRGSIPIETIFVDFEGIWQIT